MAETTKTEGDDGYPLVDADLLWKSTVLNLLAQIAYNTRVMAQIMKKANDEADEEIAKAEQSKPPEGLFG